MHISIVSIQKDEPALQEWTTYHLDGCGFDSIVLFDDGGLPKIDDPRVKTYKVDDIVGNYNSVNLPVNLPRQQLCYLWYIQDIAPQMDDFALFIDGDEYWAGNMTVKEYVQSRGNTLHDYVFNWVFYTQEEEENAPRDSILRRFCHRKATNDKHVKTLINVNLHRFDQVYFGCPHCLQSVRGGLLPWMNTSGQTGCGPFSEYPIDFDTHPYIAHFYAKSREEFLRKLSRRRPDTDNQDYQYFSDKMKHQMDSLWDERSVGEVHDMGLKYRLESI